MGTIEEKLNYTKNAIDKIKENANIKGANILDTDELALWGNKINNIETGITPSGIYTYPEGSTGANVDITNYKTVNAYNVYKTGMKDFKIDNIFNKYYEFTNPEQEIIIDFNLSIGDFIYVIEAINGNYSTFTYGNFTVKGTTPIPNEWYSKSGTLTTTYDKRYYYYLDLYNNIKLVGPSSSNYYSGGCTLTICKIK